jgi:hypothetical protein
MGRGSADRRSGRGDTVRRARALQADRPVRCSRADDHSEAVQGFMTRTQSGLQRPEACLDWRADTTGKEQAIDA